MLYYVGKQILLKKCKTILLIDVFCKLNVVYFSLWNRFKVTALIRTFTKSAKTEEQCFKKPKLARHNRDSTRQVLVQASASA